MTQLARIALFALTLSACEVSHPLDDTATTDATLGGDDADLNPPPCVGSRDCLSCTSSSMCGWCGSTSQCVPGTMEGPTAGGCPSTSWTWLPMVCPGQEDAGDPGQVRMCENAKACSTCADLVGCGWCASANRCVPGSESGSSDGACTGTDWIASTAMCP